MVDKEKFQTIFKNLIALILEYQQINFSKISEIQEQSFTNYFDLLKHIKNLNDQFSNYQLRPGYDKDTEYIERLAQQRQEIEEMRKKSQEIKDNSDFNLGQTQLNMKKITSLLQDLNFMIEDL